ncbi:MAG: heme NO-binding domain-containing protein [Phycisphaerales bacterium]
MINRAVQGLVLDRHGEETWARIRTMAKVEETEFLSMEQYPDETTYRLVAASSEVLGVPAEEILEAFGEYWIEYTAEAGYGEIMLAAGRIRRTPLRRVPHRAACAGRVDLTRFAAHRVVPSAVGGTPAPAPRGASYRTGTSRTARTLPTASPGFETARSVRRWTGPGSRSTAPIRSVS